MQKPVFSQRLFPTENLRKMSYGMNKAAIANALRTADGGMRGK